MNAYRLRHVIAVAVVLLPTAAWAQHDAHQPGTSQAESPDLAQCLQVQPAIENIIAAAMSRAEAARLSNSPTEMRAAVEHLMAALRDIRTQSAPCSTAATSTDPHAGHTMPGMHAPENSPGQTPSATIDPHAGHTMPMNTPAANSQQAQPGAGAVDQHAGHIMPGASPASSGSTAAKPAPKTAPNPAATDPHAGHAMSTAAATKPSPRSRATAVRPAETTSTDPHAAHSAAVAGAKQRDPVNGLMVDPATAPKTTYQAQTYYFSSEQSLKEFLENPAKFAKKPKG